jgi:hypothetical protein
VSCPQEDSPDQVPGLVFVLTGATEAGGASTPAVDASTPAAATSSTNVSTTAGFSPPHGAVLVALATTNVWSSTAPTVSDSSGLTWTLRSIFHGGEGMAAVYTATGPVTRSRCSVNPRRPALTGSYRS